MPIYQFQPVRAVEPRQRKWVPETLPLEYDSMSNDEFNELMFGAQAREAQARSILDDRESYL